MEASTEKMPLSLYHWEAKVQTSADLGMAPCLLGRNAFDRSLLPLVRVASERNLWPPDAPPETDQGEAPEPGPLACEVPSLELVAAACVRILAVAQGLRAQGGSELLFLGVGASNAVVEASIALLPYEPQAAVEDFTAHALPLFIFSCYPPDVKGWTATTEATAGKRLAELFLVRLPPLPGEPQDGEQVSARLRTTELFPKTPSSMGYLTSGFEEEDVGLHHSHVYVYTPWEVPQPHLADVLTHRLGPFSLPFTEDRCRRSLKLLNFAVAASGEARHRAAKLVGTSELRGGLRLAPAASGGLRAIFEGSWKAWGQNLRELT